ncbi:MAG TPA: GNAT family N-acetyltransferase [Actinomycetota bacterium]|nr:GNAT family N-acetyltransferase [Actinomycetota bacterium]
MTTIAIGMANTPNHRRAFASAAVTLPSSGERDCVCPHDRRRSPRRGPHRHVATLNYPLERGLLVVRAAAGQADTRLHQFIGGHPATLEELRARYTTLTAGSPRLEQVWRNWIVRRRADSRPVGTVQATLIRHHEGWTAQVAWIIGLPWQHQGYAAEAAWALVGWLDSRHVRDLVAHIHPDHLASAKVAMRAGFQPIHDQVHSEQVWHRQTSRPRSRCRRS